MPFVPFVPEGTHVGSEGRLVAVTFGNRHLPITPQRVQRCEETRFPKAVKTVLHTGERVGIGDRYRVEAPKVDTKP